MALLWTDREPVRTISTPCSIDGDRPVGVEAFRRSIKLKPVSRTKAEAGPPVGTLVGRSNLSALA